MTKQTTTPATKQQIDELIAVCLRDEKFHEAAGLLKLASDIISANVAKFEDQAEIEAKLDSMIADVTKAITNIREANEINTRMVDGAASILLKMQENPDHRTNETRGAYSDDEIKADYRERADLRSMAGGC